MTIVVGSIVNVTLSGGVVLSQHEVISIPGNNAIYWVLENPNTGLQRIVGPSLVAIEELDL